MKFFLLALCAASVAALPNSRRFNTVKANLGGRIIGGELARAGQFPFAAAIYTSTPDGTFFCGGTLLNEQWVLSSGQCVDGGHLFTIRLGSNSLNANDPYTTLMSSDTYVIHPEYDPLTLANDLGLIWLRLPVEFSDYLKPVDFLPFAELSDFSSGMAIGWGQIGDQEPGLVDALHWVYVNTLPNEQCKLTYGSQILDNMVCVDGSYNEGTCNGDMGGPLVQIISRGHTVVTAVASFISGNGCESVDPSGFTRLFPYKDWITNTTGKA